MGIDLDDYCDIDMSDVIFDIYTPGLDATVRRWPLSHITQIAASGGYDMSFRGDGVILSRRTASPCYRPAGNVTVLAFCTPCLDPAAAI